MLGMINYRRCVLDVLGHGFSERRTGLRADLVVLGAICTSEVVRFLCVAFTTDLCAGFTEMMDVAVLLALGAVTYFFARVWCDDSVTAAIQQLSRAAISKNDSTTLSSIFFMFCTVGPPPWRKSASILSSEISFIGTPFLPPARAIRTGL